jgi:hypothetical protein
MQDILGGVRGSRQRGHLFRRPTGGNVLGMFALGRSLQFVGLVIPPLAIMAQLGGSISLGQMLEFLLVAVGVFLMGYLLQRYSGGGSG